MKKFIIVAPFKSFLLLIVLAHLCLFGFGCAFENLRLGVDRGTTYPMNSSTNVLDVPSPMSKLLL